MTTPIAIDQVDEKDLVARPTDSAPARGSRPLEGHAEGRANKTSEWIGIHDAALLGLSLVLGQLKPDEQGDDAQVSEDDQVLGKTETHGNGCSDHAQDEDKTAEVGEGHGSGLGGLYELANEVANRESFVGCGQTLDHREGWRLALPFRGELIEVAGADLGSGRQALALLSIQLWVQVFELHSLKDSGQLTVLSIAAG